MTSGFESYHADGRIQFTSNASTFVFRAKGTLTTSHVASDAGLLSPDLRYMGCLAPGVDVSGYGRPLIVINSASNTPIMVRNYTNRNLTTGDITRYFMVYSRDVATITYYIFTPISEVTNGLGAGYGFQSFSESGELTYDARYKPLIAARQDWAPNIAPGASTAINGLASGRAYAWGFTGDHCVAGAAYPVYPSVYAGTAPYPHSWKSDVTSYPGVRQTSATSFAIEPISRGIPTIVGWQNVFGPSTASGTGGVITYDVTGY